MITALQIVRRLIEDDDFNAEQYIDDLSPIGWQIIDLVTNAEWRAWLKEVGLKLVRCTKQSRTRKDILKYESFCVLKLIADAEDAAVTFEYEIKVAEHLYKCLEKKFNSERNGPELRYCIGVFRLHYRVPVNGVEIQFGKNRDNKAFHFDVMYPVFYYDMHCGA